LTSEPNAFFTRSPWPISVKLRGTGRWLSPLRVAVLRLFGAQIAGPVLIADGVKVWHPWSLVMHRYSRLARGVEVYNFATITIGEQATVSQETYLCSASHDIEDPALPLIFSPITIETKAWVVVRDVPKWSVAVGHPARVVKRRRFRAGEHLDATSDGVKA
jgi:putative colanic acid biosynthesis acetyltransferase WcaF